MISPPTFIKLTKSRLVFILIRIYIYVYIYNNNYYYYYIYIYYKHIINYCTVVHYRFYGL